MSTVHPHLPVLASFGFATTTPPTSIYPYAPVYRVDSSGGTWVLKRTNRRSGGQPTAAWTRHLRAQGVRVVAPAEPFMPNPRRFDVGESVENWVVYPFVAAESPYLGTKEQLREAGALLGSIHAAGDQDHGLTNKRSVVELSAEDLEESYELISGHVGSWMADGASSEDIKRALNRVGEFTAAYFEDVLERALERTLPLSNCSWDYKASNIIYAKDGAVLIDPDNGGRIPRLYDLAIACVLFPNDPLMHQAPPGVLTAQDWQAFISGYAEHITLTDEERSAWPDVLLCAWLDEALWLLGDHGTGWANPRERAWLWSLLRCDLTMYTLPPERARLRKR